MRTTPTRRPMLLAAATAALIALPLAAQAAGIDPNSFRPGHPASPRWTATPVVHANAEHPAVRVARQGQAALDANHFLVQPPAAVHWTLPEAPALKLAQAR